MIAIIISIALGIVCAVLGIYILYLKVEKNVIDSTVLRRSYPCRLVVFTQFNQPREETLVDFSAYKENNTIGITLNLMQEPADVVDEFLQSCPMVSERAIVYQTVKGGYIWSTY